MLKNNILAKLMQGGGQADRRLFPWTKKQPEEQIEYAPNSFMPGEPTVPDTDPVYERLSEMANAQLSTSGITPPYAQAVNDPMHGNAGAMAKYGRPAPGAAIPLGGAYPADESNVEVPANSPMNAAGFDRSLLDNPAMTPTMSTATAKTATRPDFYGTQTQIDRQQAEYDYENPEDKDQGWKGRIKEAIANGLFTMSQAGPDTDWKALLALAGIGVGGGLVKKTWNEQREAGAKIPYLRQKEEYESRQMDAQLKRDNTVIDNARQQDEIERKREADANKAAYYQGLLNDKKRGRELQDFQIADLRTYREFLMSNGVRNTDARIRQIEAKLEDADLDRQSREGMNADRLKTQKEIATMNEGGRNSRFGIGQSNSMAKTQINSADKARSVLSALERAALSKGLNFDQTQESRNRFLESLSPEVRKQLGQ